MFMRTLRDNTKWIMLVLTVAFAGWLVFDWVQGRGGAAGQSPNPVVATVGDQEVRYSEWNRHLQQYLDQVRQSRSDPLTDEESRQAREDAWDQLVEQILIQQELDRLGIQVSNAEIRQAFRSSPPPSLRQHPAFQTNGRFDLQKYRQFFSQGGVNEQLLLQLEQYYRDVLPRSKLFRMVGAGVHVSEEEAWAHYRNRNETARARYLSVTPGEIVPDTAVSVSRSEIESHYRSHREQFTKPRSATVNVASLSTAPTAEDTARARERATSLRRRIVQGEESFAEVARDASADSATASDGGSMGRVTRDSLPSPLADVAFSEPVGQASEPVAAGRGFHLVKVDSRTGDTATVRHVLVPIELSMQAEDRLFDRMDRLESVALEKGLAEAADSVGVPVRRKVSVSEGSEFVPGAGALSVGVDWALKESTGPGDLSQFYENGSGYHMLELVERTPERTFPLEQVESRIRSTLLQRKKTKVARERLQETADRIQAGESTLERAARSFGVELRTHGPFTRLERVPGLGQGTEAIGAAFGLPLGQVSDPLDAGSRIALVEVLNRTEVTRKEFRAAEARIRAQLRAQKQQQWLSRWLQALRDNTQIQDLRDRLDQRGGQQGRSRRTAGF